MTGERGERTSPRLSRLRPACLGHYTSGKGMMQSDQEPPGVVVLYNASDKLVKGEPRDLLAEQGVIACAQVVADALQRAGYQVAQVPIYNDVELALARYSLTRWVVFNLGEGLEGRLFEEARIAWALEAMGYRFTGSDGYAISRAAHKARTKALLAAAGVPTPPWRVFRDPAEVPDAPLPGLPFPLIVKPVAEDASLGVGPEAVVHNLEALRRRVAYVVERYRQAALAESFILGREFNVSVWSEPLQVLPLAEIDFSAFYDPLECIVSFAAKWLEDSFEYHHTPVVCPADVEPWLGELIAETALRVYDIIGCRGYARVDMRVADGVPYVLEVNPNPDLSPDAGFARAACAAGYNYTAMTAHILSLALR
jgi:D-alanine-D-alanine ligase